MTLSSEAGRLTEIGLNPEFLRTREAPLPQRQSYADRQKLDTLRLLRETTVRDIGLSALTHPSERVVEGSEDWQDRANCLGVDPDLFFPEKSDSTIEAREVCRGCIVRTDCLEYALVNGEKFGIWGGLSERERRRLRRQRSQGVRRTE